MLERGDTANCNKRMKNADESLSNKAIYITTVPPPPTPFVARTPSSPDISMPSRSTVGEKRGTANRDENTEVDGGARQKARTGNSCMAAAVGSGTGNIAQTTAAVGGDSEPEGNNALMSDGEDMDIDAAWFVVGDDTDNATRKFMCREAGDNAYVSLDFHECKKLTDPDGTLARSRSRDWLEAWLRGSTPCSYAEVIQKSYRGLWT